MIHHSTLRHINKQISKFVIVYFIKIMFSLNNKLI